jgi:ferrous iron transport protein B
LFNAAFAQARARRICDRPPCAPASPGQPQDDLMSLRLRAAAELARAVVRQGERRLSWRDRLDDVLLHPFFGYLAFVGIMLVFFQIIYGLGSLIEKPVLAAFDTLVQAAISALGNGTLAANIATGLLQGISGGIAIVLPYLIPFLVGLGVLEDIGYLPRVAFLMDALMHRLGLHGKAIVPFILGYGCNVPAIMSTRILEEPRDRFLAAALATLVPCAARLAVVFGLVAYYLGPALALVVYVFNLFVIAVVGRILSRFLPEDSPGLILEMPVYRVPTVRAVLQKAWFRVREFIVEAWPILIAGSVVLALLSWFGITPLVNALVSPITWALGLPNQVGTPLLFGILRKELSLVMLAQALGGSDFNQTLSSLQMMTFAVFVVFYIPCLGTLAVLRRELGGRHTSAVVALTIVVALAAALVVRLAGWIILTISS